MRCEKHRNVEAVGFCSECGRGICEDCKVEIDGTTYCNDCADISKSDTIVCSKCGGTYKLQEGEKLSDFEACQCGGKLKSASVINEKPKTPNSIIITDVKNFFGGLTKFTNWVPIIISVIIVSIITAILTYFICLTYFPSYSTSITELSMSILMILLLLPALNGFLASYIAAKRSKEVTYNTGILYGVVAGFLGLIISAFVSSLTFNTLFFYSLYSTYGGFPSATASDTMGSFDSMSSDIDAPQVNNQNWWIVLIYKILTIFIVFINPLFLLISIIFGGLGGFLAIKLRKK